MNERIIWRTYVTEVNERTVTVSGSKSADGTSMLKIESAGWYVRLGNISLYVGEERPKFDKGDKVIITLEKERENANKEIKD